MLDINFLFRFRDLIAPTLTEHKKIIDKYGECWWGWWKRPSEDARLEIWDALEKVASPDVPIPVGLFDSGSGNVFTAWVTAVVRPAISDDGRIEHPPLDGEELPKVPEYYRNSPFSRAWIKIVKIEGEKEFFGGHSFSNMPRIPNYSDKILLRFKDKIISGADELRNMDLTVWEVRPKRGTDSDEKILLSITGIVAPISREPVNLVSGNVLHLSDLHFSSDDFRENHSWKMEGDQGGGYTLAEAISDAVDGIKIGALVISGDLTFIGSDGEFEHALNSIRRLMGQLDIGPENIIVVPGNHDIVWQKDEPYTDNIEVRLASNEAAENYRKFYSALFNHDASESLAVGRRFVLPSGVVVEFGGVNSSSLEQGKDFLAGMGRIEEKAFNEIVKEMNWKIDPGSRALKILVHHHHLALVDDLEPTQGFGKGFGIAIDAPRTQRLAAKAGVQLVIHGHKHQPFFWRSSVSELPDKSANSTQLGELSIIGGGSAGSSDLPKGMHSFNLLNIGAMGIAVELFQSENKGGFDVTTKRKADFKHDPENGRLLLGDWEVIE